MGRVATSGRYPIRRFLNSYLFNQNASAASSANTIAGSGALTMAAWVKLASGASFQTIMSIGNSSHYCEIILDPTLRPGLCNNTINIFSPASLTAGVWYLILGTYAGGAGGSVTTYVNGGPVVSGTFTNAIASTNFFESVLPTGGLPLSGTQIAESFMWNRVLTSAEIAQLYSANIVPSGGLVCWYPHTQGVGTTVADLSGNGKTLTITLGASGGWVLGGNAQPLLGRPAASGRVAVSGRVPK